jgi:predicted DNA-binding protein
MGTMVPDEIHEKLEEIAKRQYRPMSNLIRMIIADWINRYEEGEITDDLMAAWGLKEPTERTLKWPKEEEERTPKKKPTK